MQCCEEQAVMSPSRFNKLGFRMSHARFRLLHWHNHLAERHDDWPRDLQQPEQSAETTFTLERFCLRRSSNLPQAPSNATYDSNRVRRRHKSGFQLMLLRHECAAQQIRSEFLNQGFDTQAKAQIPIGCDENCNNCPNPGTAAW